MTEPRRRPGPKRGLTEQDVLDAALTLMDTDGPAAASIRRIATALGVTPNAVYTYFPDKSGIEQALIERLLGEVNRAASRGGDWRADQDGAVAPGGDWRADQDGAVAPGGGWRADLELLAFELRRQLTAHPGAVPLLLGGAMNGPEALRIGERLLAALARGGLSKEAAARGSYLVMVYVLGAIALEVADVPHTGALAPEAERIAARRTAMALVPAQMYPRTAAAADVAATWIGTEQFRWGLHRVLDGLSGPGLRTRTACREPPAEAARS